MPKNPQKGNSSSESSQILILQFPIPRASLPPSPSLSNPTLANWNPSSTQSSSYSSLVSLFCHTPFDHAPPKVLNIQNHMPQNGAKFLYKMVGAPSFSQPHLCMNYLEISPKNPFLYFSQFLPPYSALTCSQNHPYNLH